jgi:hypothetical protein
MDVPPYDIPSIRRSSFLAQLVPKLFTFDDYMSWNGDCKNGQRLLHVHTGVDSY